MLFNSAEFLIFFPIAALVYYLIPHKVRYLWLLACSYYFYMCWNPVYALLLLFSTAITYLCSLALEHAGSIARYTGARRPLFLKKVFITLSFLANLGVLSYFKYGNFLIDNLNALLSHLHIVYQAPAIDVLLPVGISFYTFQALGYTMDVYRDNIRAERNFLRYALFVSFFPQLVAGPIERSKNLLAQFTEVHKPEMEKIRSGFLLMLWGYFLKLVLSDRISIVVNTVYADPAAYPGWYLVVASVLFAFQIYCDFAGYSIIAKGAAEMMGFRLMDNFNAPYLSRSVSEFWRRWHISLSSWFKDYLYIPLGGNRKGVLRKHINLLIVFLVSGLWHGAEWSFVIWGLINGLYQTAGAALRPLRDRIVRLARMNRDTFSHRLLQMGITFVLIDISWVFFRADSIHAAIQIFESMLTASNLNILFDDSLFALGLDWKNFMLMTASIGVLMIADICTYRGVCIRNLICKQELWFRWLVMIFSVVFIVVFGVWGSGFSEASFIYFQF
ncbi:MAG: MBOAT family protein [Clostridia bacterium]|nr:MBOAT family protein [Clostridia bacterium]